MKKWTKLLATSFILLAVLVLGTAIFYGNGKGETSKSLCIEPLFTAVESETGSQDGLEEVTPVVTLNKNSFEYNERQQTPLVTVQVGNLILGEDGYDLVWDDAERIKVGIYTATVTLKGNYSGSGQASYSIEKKNANSVKVTVEDIYYGQTPTADVTLDGFTLNAETDYDVNFGDYSSVTSSVTATVTFKGNFTGVATGTYKVNRKLIAKPQPDETQFIYNGEPQTYSIASGEGYQIGGTLTATNAGKQKILVMLDSNHAWEDGSIVNLTYDFVIGKATYDMSKVAFVSQDIREDGKEHSLAIDGTLPDGVTVSYDGNGKKEPGVYAVTATFMGDYANYFEIADMTATLTIKTASKTFRAEDGTTVAEIIDEKGAYPLYEFTLKELVVDDELNIFDHLDDNQKVASAYEIKLSNNGDAVQPDGKVTVKLRIPEQLKGQKFSVVHLHKGTEFSQVEYEIDGDYAVFTVDKLSDFAFVYETESLSWTIVILSIACVFLLVVFVAQIAIVAKRKNKGKKLLAVFPPVMFGKIVSQGEYDAVIGLAFVVIVLLLINIIFYRVTKVPKKTRKINEKNNPVTKKRKRKAVVAVNEQKTIQPVVTAVESTVKPKTFKPSEFISVQYLRSFTAKIVQSDDETKQIYSTVKNELLSYKKVKSRVSWKHETFKVGRTTIAKLKFRGKTLSIYLALDPSDYADSKYKIKDATVTASLKDTPCAYKLSNARRVKYSKDLIFATMAKLGVERVEVEPVDYLITLPYQTDDELIAKGLIKVVEEETPVVEEVDEVVRTEVSAYEVNDLMSDEEAKERETFSERTADKRKRGFINADTLNRFFDNGEKVTLEEIKKRVPSFDKKLTYYKVLARGKINKVLIVDADDYSIEAEKMILLTGGTVLRSKN